MSGSAKLQRWVDLLAALLVRTHPASFEELARDVPEYRQKLDAALAEGDEARRRTAEQSLKRAFERDKDELRAFGVPIESVPDEHGNTAGAYRLRRRDFYLPYLCVALPDGATAAPERVDRWGYQALTSLAFEPEELQAVVDAAACVRTLGDPLLAAEAASAMRKLAVDLPLDTLAASPDAPHVVLPRARPDAAVFELLGDALARRKTVCFTYRSMRTGRSEAREVDPYGLFFVHGHWYLAAHDHARGELRNFRLNRIASAEVNGKRPQSADYEIPSDFRLREHARSRQAWELGSGDAVEATVAFLGQSGPTRAAARLGRPVEGDARLRAFDVRREETFVRWLLSFAGEARPVAPAPLVQRWQDEARRIAALHAAARPGAAVVEGESAGAASDAAAPAAPAAADATPDWQPRGAAAQLRRILLTVPQIADGEEHPLGTIAERVGCDVATLRRDLFSLVSRFDLPAGFVEGVQLCVEPDRVSAVSNHLLRPMRLTGPELCALELGLAVLRARRPPDEQPPLERARERLRAVIAKLPDEPLPGGVHAASLGEHASATTLGAIRRALGERRKLRLVYRKSGASAASTRTIAPHALVFASGMLYLIGYRDEDDAMRVFRLDRVEEAEALGEPCAVRATVSLDELLRDGRVFHAEEPERLRVRYSPRVARWIAEREALPLATDGSLTVDHPMADHEWGLRHVLQYGAEAEVLAPATMRKLLNDRAAKMAQ